MKKTLVVGLLLTLSSVGSAQTTQSRVAFAQLVKKTYNFDSSRLTPQQMMATEKRVDKFWNTVKANKKEYLPLLRTEIKNPRANKFFRFNGVNLLMNLDPSLASKKQLVDIYTLTDLGIVGPRRWLETMTWMGKDGLDISRGAVRWLSDPKAHYTLPEHGDFKVDYFTGALFLFGSLSEDKATPALIKIVNDPKNSKREAALSILMDQATPTAFKAINALDSSTFTPEFQKIINNYRTYPTRITPREVPRITRQQYLLAFQDLVLGKPERFKAIVNADEDGDGERDVVSVMKTEDLPLLRKVRRATIANANPHAISFYNSFTDIIMTLVQRTTAKRIDI